MKKIMAATVILSSISSLSYAGIKTQNLSITEGSNFVSHIVLSGIAKKYKIKGMDRKLFSVDPATGNLRFITAPNFDTPLDRNHDNKYIVTVKTKYKSAKPSRQRFIITILPDKPNQPPTADAGDSLRVAENDRIQLDAVNSFDDKEIVSYQWRSDDAILSRSQQLDTVLPLGTHRITLKVTDAQGLTDSDSITVSVLDSAAFTNETRSKNPDRLADRDSMLDVLAANKTAQRNNASQKYSNQNNQTSSDVSVALELLAKLEATAIASENISITSTYAIPLAAGEMFSQQNIYLETRAGKRYLVNRTNRIFSNLIGEYADKNTNVVFTRLIFDRTIEPHTEYELEHFNNDEVISITDIAPLYEHQMKFETRTDVENGNPIQNIYKAPDEQQQAVYNKITANTKHLNNSIHAFTMLNNFAEQQSYLGYDFSWAYSDAYTYKLRMAPNLHEYVYKQLFTVLNPIDYFITLKVAEYKGSVTMGTASLGGAGGSSWVSINEFFMTTYNDSYQSMWTGTNTYYHEMMHAYGYNHDSAMTFGYSDVVSTMQYLFNGKEQVIEELPEYVFSTKKIADDQYKISVFKTGISDEKYFNVGLYSNELLSAEIIELKGENAFIVNTDNGSAPHFILRVFSFDSNQVMSKIIKE